MPNDAINVQFIGAPTSEPKPALEKILKLQGVTNVKSGPTQTDGPKEFAEAEAAARDVMIRC